MLEGVSLGEAMFECKFVELGVEDFLGGLMNVFFIGFF